MRSPRRAARTGSAPASCSSRTVAAPMPEEAPVTTMTLPVSSTEVILAHRGCGPAPGANQTPAFRRRAPLTATGRRGMIKHGTVTKYYGLVKPAVAGTKVNRMSGQAPSWPDIFWRKVPGIEELLGMRRTHRLTAAAAVLALTTLVAACGGGGTAKI